MSLFTDGERAEVVSWIKAIDQGAWDPTFDERHLLKTLLKRVLEADLLVESAGAVVESHKKLLESVEDVVESQARAETLKGEIISFGPAKWEYVCVHANFSDTATKLTAYGQHGWELVAVNAKWTRAIMKREVVSDG